MSDTPAEVNQDKPFLLKCECGTRCFISSESFNEPGKLEFGTPYVCPSCNKPLRSKAFYQGVER